MWDDCMNQEVSEGNAEDMPEVVLPDKDLQLERETEIPKPAENSKKINLGSGYVSKIMLFSSPPYNCATFCLME
jgi:hypothetical protein